MFIKTALNNTVPAVYGAEPDHAPCRQYRCLGIGNSFGFLMNLSCLTDVGRSFAFNDNVQPENYTFGAYGKFVDPEPMLSRESVYFIK